ncbi:MAG: ompA [Flavipsychrobacter sp.]|nr:ompA [Flavipsychrobacter sp.]
MRLIVIFLLLAGMLFPFHTQGKRKRNAVRANYYYSHYGYADAIPHLEKLIATGNSNLDVHVKLGDCYRLTGNAEKAAKAYARATSMKKCGDITFLNYGLVLMKLRKYEEAEKYFRKYLEKTKKDDRVANLFSSCKSAPGKLNDFPSGITTFASFNTDGNEFAPSLSNGNLIFTSNDLSQSYKEKDRWSGAQFCGIYCVPLTGPGEYGSNVSELFGSASDNYHRNRFKNELHTAAGTFTADGNELYYTVSAYNRKFAARRASLIKDTTVLLKIMIGSGYDEKRKTFSKFRPFRYNSTEYSVAHPSVSPDGNMLVFVSDMPGGSGMRDLYLCKKEGGKWTEPVNAGVIINTGGDECFPWWAGNTTLFFSSDGREGFGGLDIYKTEYRAGSFSIPENMPAPINSPYDDISQAIAINLDSAYISSDRPSLKSGDNIFHYEKREVYLHLNVRDSATQLPIENVSIRLSAAMHKKDTVSATGLMFTRLYPETKYNVHISKDGYRAREFELNTNSTKKADTIYKKIDLVNPEKPHYEIVTPIVMSEPQVIRNKNVMDSPGVQNFTLNEVYEVGDFSYDYNKYELTKAHTKFLDTLVAQLKRNTTMVIEIHAHTDCRGSEASNVKLSTSRALSVVNYLEQHGIQRARVQYKGLGSSMPKVPCPDCSSCTEQQHALNRIFEFKVLHL